MKKNFIAFFSFYAAFLTSIFYISPLASIPPPAPSAGVIEREIEKEYEPQPLQEPKSIPDIQIDLPEHRLEIPMGQKVLIHTIKIQGNTVFSEQEICEWVGGCIHRELSMKDIYDICKIIEKNYAEQGYFLARAYPPEQKLKDKTLILEIIEGTLGSISVVGNHYYSTKFIENFFSHLKGDPLNYNDFIKALMLLNETSDLSAGSIFEKGKTFGTTDVTIRVKDDRPNHLYVNMNDYGRDLTTHFRAGGRLDKGSLLVYGDKLSIAQVVGFPVQALYFSDIIYNIPLNSRGTFMEFAYLFSHFKIEELKSLHLKGRSNIATLKLSQAIKRRKEFSIDMFLTFDYKQIRNYVLSTETSFDKLRNLTLGFLFDHYTFLRGRDYATVRVAAGIPYILGGMAPHSSHSSRVGGGATFVKVNLDYDRLQQLPLDSFLAFHLSGQWSPNKLTLPEQIYIGGADTVRGFPLADALGDSGYYANLEFRVPPLGLANKNIFGLQKKWKEVIQLVAFLDTGGTFLNGSGPRTMETGVGCGFRLKLPFQTAISFDMGIPLNHKSRSHPVFLYFKLTGAPF